MVDDQPCEAELRQRAAADEDRDIVGQVFEQFAEHAECGAVVERLEFVEVKMHGAIELREPARGPVRQAPTCRTRRAGFFRSEEHTSELQSLMRTSYAVFCLKKKKH